MVGAGKVLVVLKEVEADLREGYTRHKFSCILKYTNNIRKGFHIYPKNRIRNHMPFQGSQYSRYIKAYNCCINFPKFVKMAFEVDSVAMAEAKEMKEVLEEVVGNSEE